MQFAKQSINESIQYILNVFFFFNLFLVLAQSMLYSPLPPSTKLSAWQSNLFEWMNIKLWLSFGLGIPLSNFVNETNN